jgi:hypothetical protein
MFCIKQAHALTPEVYAEQGHLPHVFNIRYLALPIPDVHAFFELASFAAALLMGGLFVAAGIVQLMEHQWIPMRHRQNIVKKIHDQDN